MQTARRNSKRSLRNRAHARGAIVRTVRRRLCAALSTKCRPKHNAVHRSCTRLGTISKDPIGFAANDPNLYRYVGNGPTNATDPSGLLERDKDGNLVFRQEKEDVGGGHSFYEDIATGKLVKVKVLKGYILANDGKTKITVFKNLSGNSKFDANCHGFAYADGKYWIQNDVVSKLVVADGYKPRKDKDDFKRGYTILYFDPKTNEMVHSATVVTPGKVNSAKAIDIEGSEIAPSISTPSKAYSGYPYFILEPKWYGKNSIEARCSKNFLSEMEKKVGNNMNQKKTDADHGDSKKPGAR